MSFSKNSLNLVDELAESEYQNAIKNWGEIYSSLHEGYAILKEEVEECECEMNGINCDLGIIWKKIKDSDEDLSIFIDYIQRKAYNQILELAQVIAVCKKINNTIKEVKDERMC